MRELRICATDVQLLRTKLRGKHRLLKFSHEEMLEPIVLSDESNDSNLARAEEAIREHKIQEHGNDQTLDDLFDDFDFPEVHFDDTHKANSTGHYDFIGTKNYSPIRIREYTNTSKNCSPPADKHNVQTQEKCSSDLEDELVLTCPAGLPEINTGETHNGAARRSKSFGDDSKSPKKTQRKVKTTLARDKNKIAEERLKKQEELARNRALKAIATKKSKDLKPGECMKFMEVTIDKGIRNFGSTAEITKILDEANVNYTIVSQLIPNSVRFKRNVEDCYVDDTNKICTIQNTEEIYHMIIVWNWQEVVEKIADNTFCTSISSIRDLVPNHKITIVIFGIEEYFVQKKQEKAKSKDRSNSKERKKKKRSDTAIDGMPTISRRQLEVSLVEIQIMQDCNSRLVDTPEELGLMISQYTKSIAEIPFKMERNKNLHDKFDWYIMGDNKDTVKVDKDGNGLKRLWEQQLRQFNNSSLEIAQAICLAYPSPALLMEAYMNCTEQEGMNLLKDLPIRRAAGPLTTTRKIGIELSKKVYTMFTSEGGDVVL